MRELVTGSAYDNFPTWSPRGDRIAFAELAEEAAGESLPNDLPIRGGSDNRLVWLAQRSYYAELLEAGVQLHLYRDRFLHAKHLSVDDEIALIGSSNVDVRSFVLNAEVTLIAYDRAVAQELRAQQERCIAASNQLTLEQWEARPQGVKLAENLARLISPLL